MTNFISLTLICLCQLIPALGWSQSPIDLQRKIEGVVLNKSATVGVAVHNSKGDFVAGINVEQALPMQSVYKLHLAFAVLKDVDQGKLSLDMPITFTKEKVKAYSHLWSPIKKAYPNGITLPLSDVIEYTVAWSDNLGCDILFDLVGGPAKVESLMNSLGIQGISIQDKEIIIQKDWSKQFENWTTPRAANKLLQIIYENKNEVMSPSNNSFLLNILKETQTGKNFLRAGIPKSATLAHKTGHSGKNKHDITGAQNDMGLVFLSENEVYYISVFVSNSSEVPEINQRIISEISRHTWEYFQDSQVGSEK